MTFCRWCSFAQSCLTLCNPMKCNTFGSFVLHYLLEFAQTHVHWMGDAIQPSHPLLPLLLLPSIFPSNSVFFSESILCIWRPKKSFSFSISPSKEIPGLISFRMDWLDLLASKGLPRVFSNATVQKHQFFGAQPSSQSNSYIHTWPLEKPEPWLDGP